MFCPNCKGSTNWRIERELNVYCMIYTCKDCDYRYIIRDGDFILYNDLQLILQKKYDEYERERK
jgi:hypothetical protein